MMPPLWKLANAEERAAADPATFRIPTMRERYGLTVGDDAKLIFETPIDPVTGNAGERMWVRVKRVVAPGKYVGMLVNNPTVLSAALVHGDTIEFGAEHVADIDRDEDTQ